MKSNTDEAQFMRLAINEARRSRHEDEERPHPFVGAVVVRDGQVLASACRGDQEPGEHAEYTALEKKLRNATLAGATVYTTLEPCTTRNLPKIPCADRLIERRVKRVVIGMLDPDQRITGKGILRLRRAGIEVDLFPHDMMAELEELNRGFVREKERADMTPTALGQATTRGVAIPTPNLVVVRRLSFECSPDSIERIGWQYESDHGHPKNAHLEALADPVLGSHLLADMAPGTRLDYRLPPLEHQPTVVTFVMRNGPGFMVYVRLALLSSAGVTRDGWLTVRSDGPAEVIPYGDGFSEWAIPWTARRLHDDWIAVDVDAKQSALETFARVGQTFGAITGVRLRDRVDIASISFCTRRDAT